MAANVLPTFPLTQCFVQPILVFCDAHEFHLPVWHICTIVGTFGVRPSLSFAADPDDII
jgi:hypothetical protein